MSTLRYYVAITLDGFLAREDDSFDVFVGEGGHVTDYVEFMRAQRVVLMGRRTYDVGLRLGVTNPYPWLRQIVFSRTLSASPDPNVEVVAGSPVEYVTRLKAEESDTDLWLCGGGVVATALFDAGLIDEVILKVSPVLLGAGKPVVETLRAPVTMELTASKTHANGVVVLHYRVRSPATRPSEIAAEQASAPPPPPTARPGGSAESR